MTSACWISLGLIVTVIAGVLNIVLDYIFMAIMELGVGGAAVATRRMWSGVINFLSLLLLEIRISYKNDLISIHAEQVRYSLKGMIVRQALPFLSDSNSFHVQTSRDYS